MFLPGQSCDLESLAKILLEIQPDEVQLNTPTRPYPKEWHYSSRGGHSKELRQYESTPLRPISHEQAAAWEERLKELTGLRMISVYERKKV